MKKIARGFTTLEMLLVIIILAIVGFTGYHVYNSKKQTDKLLNGAQSEQVAVKTNAVKSFTDCQKAAGSKIETTYPEICVTKSGQRFTQPTSPSNQTFVFKELGVQMTLPDSLSGLNYTVDNGYLYLADYNYVNALKKCSDYQSGQNGGGFTSIGKTAGQYPANANPADIGSLLKQFPDFYINYGVPNGNACSDLSQSGNLKTVGDTERAAFIDAFQKSASLVQ